MRFLDRLFRSAPSDESEAPAIPATSPATPVEDDAEMLELTPFGNEPDEVLTLEDIFTGIEYTDSKGESSRRRITLRMLKAGPYAPILSAVCHERGALRSFRVDRINTFIDQFDGEIIEPRSFFAKTLDIDIASQVFSDEAEPKVQPTAFARRNERASHVRLFEALNPAVSVLVTIARVDGTVDTELAAILDYIEAEAYSQERADRYGLIDPTKIDTLVPRLRAMRPRRISLDGHLASISQLSSAEIGRFESAVRRVIHADGVITDEEIEIYSIVDEWRSRR